MTAKARITAIDRFIKGCREDGIYDDLNACCVMAGWDSLAGALTPLVGAAPTNSGFIATDYDRGGIGITGDGTSYLDSNRDVGADSQDDAHISVHLTAASQTNGYVAGRASATFTLLGQNLGIRTSALYADAAIGTGTLAVARNASNEFFYMQASGTPTALSVASGSPGTGNLHVFKYNPSGAATANTLSFYSIGSSLGSDPATGLAALDARVSTLMADLRAIEEVGFDRDALAYLRAVEEADNAFLETSVKVAVNNLVSGLKADGLWDAIGSTCLLCGPRTLAGALVPLRGDTPIAYNFASGDFDRIGLEGNATNTFLNASRLNSASPQDDVHYAVYQSTPATTGILMGSGGASSGANNLWEQNLIRTRCQSANIKSGASVGSVAGFLGMNRSNSASYDVRYGGVADSHTDASTEPGDTITTIFARGTTGGGRDSLSDAKISFYSIGTSLVDLAKLDTHISDYVTAIGAAL